MLLRSETEYLFCLVLYTHVLIPLYFRPTQVPEDITFVQGFSVAPFGCSLFQDPYASHRTCWNMFTLEIAASSTFSFSSTLFNPVSAHIPKLLSYFHYTSSNRCFLAFILQRLKAYNTLDHFFETVFSLTQGVLSSSFATF